MDLLTDNDVLVLVVALLTTRPDHTASEDDLEILLKWANQTVAMATILDLVKSGVAKVDVRDGELCFALREEARPGG